MARQSGFEVLWFLGHMDRWMCPSKYGPRAEMDSLVIGIGVAFVILLPVCSHSAANWHHDGDDEPQPILTHVP